MKTHGDKLRAAREFLGLTQDQVASTLNLTRNIIVNIENNKRAIKADELYNFSKLYGITMEEIVSDEKEVDMDSQVFSRGFDNLSEKDKKEIINLIKFKNDYKG